MLLDALLEAATEPKVVMAVGGCGTLVKVGWAVKGDLDLLARVVNVELGEGAALESGNEDGGEAKGVVVEGVSLVEIAQRDDNIEVGEAGKLWQGDKSIWRRMTKTATGQKRRQIRQKARIDSRLEEKNDR